MIAGWAAAGLAAVLALAVLLVVRTANRLDRLHVRTDAAWAALDGVLARRAAVVRALVGVPRSLRAVAERTRTTDPTEREAAENELTAALAALDRVSLEPLVAAELADAEQRVVIARRVHADAVRDTRAFRRRRLVRWLRLAGTAPWPRFFEIAEPRDEPAWLPVRPSARVLVVDPADRVLLLRHADPRWHAPGSGLEPGEDLRCAAVRGLAEATDAVVAPAALTGPVWFRREVSTVDGCDVDRREWHFLLRGNGTVRCTAPDPAGHRWWTAAELAASAETVRPAGLASLLPALLATPWDGVTRRIS